MENPSQNLDTQNQNPYAVGSSVVVGNGISHEWAISSNSVLLDEGLLRRRIRIIRPIECLLEYRADRLSDQIFIDGKLAISRLPLFWLHEKFDFVIERETGIYRFNVRLKIGRLLRIHEIEIQVNDQLVYLERSGTVVDSVS